jgi:hypothetical protein
MWDGLAVAAERVLRLDWRHFGHLAFVNLFDFFDSQALIRTNLFIEIYKLEFFNYVNNKTTSFNYFYQ